MTVITEDFPDLNNRVCLNFNIRDKYNMPEFQYTTSFQKT